MIHHTKESEHTALLESQNKLLLQNNKLLEKSILNYDRYIINLKSIIEKNEVTMSELKQELISYKSKYGALLKYHADKQGFNLKKVINDYNKE